MSVRAYQWSFAELIDRLNIVNQKIAYASDDEKAQTFVKERDEIVHDLNQFIKEGVEVTGEILNAICCLQFVNVKIWQNEEEQRGDIEAAAGKLVDWEQKYKTLLRSHHWNANRGNLKKFIQQKLGGRIDHKLNYYVTGGFDFKL